MYLRSTTSIIKKLLRKKWLYLLNALFVFNGTFKIEKSNLLTYNHLYGRYHPTSELSQTLSGPNVSEDTKGTFFEHVLLVIIHTQHHEVSLSRSQTRK